MKTDRRPRGKVGEDGLTDRQRELWRSMLEFQATNGRPGSAGELAARLGVSKGAITNPMEILIQKGRVVNKGTAGQNLRKWAIDPETEDAEYLLSMAELSIVNRGIRLFLDRHLENEPSPSPLKSGRALAGIVEEWITAANGAARDIVKPITKRHGIDGLTDRQRAILLMIAGQAGPVRVVDLEDKAGVRGGGLAWTLARLEMKGRIERCRVLGAVAVKAVEGAA